jgi:hypothetical protein
MKNEIKTLELVPKVFDIKYGLSLGPKNFSVKIEDQTIFPVSDFLQSANTNKKIPSDEEWKDFWIKLEQIGIWKWNKSYSPQDMLVLDGTVWNIKIEFGNKKIESSGSNAYPGNNIGETNMNMSKSFKKFLDALEELTGSKIERYDD